MNYWLEAKRPKRMAGKDREVKERFKCPADAAIGYMGNGDAKKVNGDHPAPDRDAPLESIVDEMMREEIAKEMGTAEPEEPKTDDLKSLVLDALEDGRKPALVEALGLVGLDPNDYSNNPQRADALFGWMESQ